MSTVRNTSRYQQALQNRQGLRVQPNSGVSIFGNRWHHQKSYYVPDQPTPGQRTILQNIENKLLEPNGQTGGVIITGVPGTGKSAVAKMAYNLCHDNTLSFARTLKTGPTVEGFAKDLFEATQLKIDSNWTEYKINNFKFNVINNILNYFSSPSQETYAEAAATTDIEGLTHWAQKKILPNYGELQKRIPRELIATSGWLDSYALGQTNTLFPGMFINYKYSKYDGSYNFHIAADVHCFAPNDDQSQLFMPPRIKSEENNPSANQEFGYPWALWINGEQPLDVTTLHTAITAMTMGGVAIIDDLPPLTEIAMEIALKIFLDTCENQGILPIITTNQSLEDLLNGIRQRPLMSRLGSMEIFNLVNRDFRNRIETDDQKPAPNISDDELRAQILQRITQV